MIQRKTGHSLNCDRLVRVESKYSKGVRTPDRLRLRGAILFGVTAQSPLSDYRWGRL